MKQFKIGLILYGLALSPSPGEIVLAKGEQRWIRIPGLEKFALGGPEIRALPLGNGGKDGVLIKAAQAGASSLWIRKRDGSTETRRVRIETWDSSGAQTPPLWRAVGALQETEVLPAGEKAVFRGFVSEPGEWSRLRSLLRSFPESTLDETEWAPELWKKLDQETNQLLSSDQALSKLQWRTVSSNQRALEGSLTDPRARKRIEALFAGHSPKVSIDLDGFADGARTVFFRVFLLEMKRDAIQKFGLEWPEGKDAAFTVSPMAIQASPLDFPVALRAMESEGNLRVLSNPELALRAPGEAELFAGGEIPIHEKSRNSVHIVWKPHGLLLRLKATELAESKVRLEISTEMSHLDTATAIEEVPGLRTSRLRTQVDARMGEPLFLSGLLQEDLRENARGLPWLRRIPVLGTLFGSSDYWNQRSELVAILLPHRAPPPAPMEKLGSPFPKGILPPPRNWLSPFEIRALRESPDFPWNAF